MKVRELHLSSGVFVVVTTDTGEHHFLVREGQQVKQSLLEDALDFRQKAARLLVLAQLVEDAANTY